MRSDIKRQVPVWLALGAMGVFVAACGVTSATDANIGKAPGGAPVASETTQTITRLTPSPSPSAGGAAPAAQAPAGPVTLSLDKTHYSPGDTAVVTISNGLDATISSTDHKTSCSLVTLEQLVGGAWQAVEPCRSMIATRVVDLAPRGVTPQRIGIPPNQPGTYRVAFMYAISAGAGDVSAASAQSGPIYSPTFTVG